MIFEAQYNGSCAGCDGRIAIGDRVTYTTDGGVVHENCPDQLFESDTKFQGTTLDEMGY
jgi:hypothetical protein